MNKLFIGLLVAACLVGCTTKEEREESIIELHQRDSERDVNRVVYVTLEDGTECAVMYVWRGAAMSCNWGGVQ